MKLLAKLLIILLFTSSLIYLTFWLWQRQPKSKNNQPVQISEEQPRLENQQEIFTISPKNYAVLVEKKVNFQGQAPPNSFVLIYSNTAQEITSVKEDGTFNREFTLEDGLNLVDIATISSDLQTENTIHLTYYLKTPKEISQEANIVYAGSTKSILDNLITIASNQEEKSIQIQNNTIINLPPSPSQTNLESTNSAATNIRIGDFLIVLGNTSDDQTILAKNIKVLRENKPKVEEEYFLARVLSNPHLNLFSIRNERNAKILEFTLDKNSKLSKSQDNISQASSTLKITDIKKDSKAIILSHKETGSNIVDFIYLLP